MIYTPFASTQSLHVDAKGDELTIYDFPVVRRISSMYAGAVGLIPGKISFHDSIYYTVLNSVYGPKICSKPVAVFTGPRCSFLNETISVYIGGKLIWRSYDPKSSPFLVYTSVEKYTSGRDRSIDTRLLKLFIDNMPGFNHLKYFPDIFVYRKEREFYREIKLSVCNVATRIFGLKSMADARDVVESIMRRYFYTIIKHLSGYLPEMILISEDISASAVVNVHSDVIRVTDPTPGLNMWYVQNYPDMKIDRFTYLHYLNIAKNLGFTEENFVLIPNLWRKFRYFRY